MKNPTEKQRQTMEALAQAVLDTRLRYPGSSLADLYDPLIHHFTVSQFHSFIISQFHHFTVSQFHHFTISQFHSLFFNNALTFSLFPD